MAVEGQHREPSLFASARQPDREDLNSEFSPHALLNSSRKRFFVALRTPETVSFLLLATQPESNYRYDTTKEDKEDIQEATASLAIAKETSTDAAEQVDGIFTGKEEQITALKAFHCDVFTSFRLALARVTLNAAARHGMVTHG